VNEEQTNGDAYLNLGKRSAGMLYASALANVSSEKFTGFALSTWPYAGPKLPFKNGSITWQPLLSHFFK